MLTRCLYGALWPFKQNHLKNVFQDIFLAAKVWNGADSVQRYPNIMTAYYNFSQFCLFCPLHISLWHFERWTHFALQPMRRSVPLTSMHKVHTKKWQLTVQHDVRAVMRCISSSGRFESRHSQKRRVQRLRLCLDLSHSVQWNKYWTLFFSKSHMSSEHSWTFPKTSLYLSNEPSQDLAAQRTSLCPPHSGPTAPVLANNRWSLDGLMHEANDKKLKLK